MSWLSNPVLLMRLPSAYLSRTQIWFTQGHLRTRLGLAYVRESTCYICKERCPFTVTNPLPPNGRDQFRSHDICIYLLSQTDHSQAACTAYYPYNLTKVHQKRTRVCFCNTRVAKASQTSAPLNDDPSLQNNWLLQLAKRSQGYCHSLAGIWALINILSRQNGHSSQKKSYLSRNFRPLVRGAFRSSDLSQKHSVSFAKLSPA